MWRRATMILLVLCFYTSASFANKFENDKISAVNMYLKSTYETLNSQVEKPDYEVFKKAMVGYFKLKDQGKVQKDILTIIDFRISSTKKRMWIIDVKNNTVLHHSLVSHGKNSGWDIPEKFSNTHNTNMSSLGFYLTGEEYIGKYGLSLRLDGMERGFNHNARSRAIVMHPADYVSSTITKTMGRLGRSFGCPAIPYKESKKVVNMISGKSVFFIYAADKDYIQKTTFADELAAYQVLEKSGHLNMKAFTDSSSLYNLL